MRIRLCQRTFEELEGIARLRTIFNTARHKINALGDLLGPLNGISLILKQEGMTGLVSQIKNRLGYRVFLITIVFLTVLPAVLTLFYARAYAEIYQPGVWRKIEIKQNTIIKVNMYYIL